MKKHLLKNADRIILERIKHCVSGHVSEDLAIAALARRFAINRDKLKAGFKELFGLTVHQYVIEQRMQLARTYLLQTDYPIKDIASRIGYSQRNFFADFKRHTGQTPGDFRRNNFRSGQPTLF